MKRLAVWLVCLLLAFTFNAYACVLPLQTVTQKDCSSDTDEQARQICDAFLEIGPQSQPSTNPVISVFNLECAGPIPFPDTFVPVFDPIPAPRGAETLLHVSIPITVLRI